MKRSVLALVALVVAVSVRGVVAVLEAVITPASVAIVGSLQSELGCPGDWDPACLRSWLQDPSGTGDTACVGEIGAAQVALGLR